MRIGGIGYYQDMNYMSGIRGSQMNIPKVGQADPALQDVKLSEDKTDALSQSSVTAVPQAEETRADRKHAARIERSETSPSARARL